ncbi:ATP-binding protein [Haliovirga abyssi]|uniref:Anti-sigma factor n=1 Tax=Haliovirga abyssi TaxID=2996794 RepID=A0AAU9D7P3_9FUSO|nr:ATP-binding protein [Haliovirga abyssi]BDU50583.1 anti-sigma factor [Haliovirga abyssi]
MYCENIFYLNSNLEEIQKMRYEFRKLSEKYNYDFETIYYIELVIGEALANAMKYGVEFDKNKKIQFEIKLSEKDVMLIIRYNGNGVNQKTVDEHAVLKNPEQVEELGDNGRGIFLIHKIMDRVEYDNSKDEIEIKMYKVIKKRGTPEKEVPN